MKLSSQDSPVLEEDPVTSEETLEAVPAPSEPISSDLRPTPPRSKKATRKAKPSRRVVSQTVVYKTKPRDELGKDSEQPGLPEVTHISDGEEEERTGEEETEAVREEDVIVSEEQEMVTTADTHAEGSKHVPEEIGMKENENGERNRENEEKKKTESPEKVVEKPAVIKCT